MGTNILFGLWIFYVIAILVMYHKVFDVVYFDLGRGLMKELVIAAFGGMILAAITVKFWVLSAIIIIITGLVCRGGSCIIDSYGHYLTKPVWDKETII